MNIEVMNWLLQCKKGHEYNSNESPEYITKQLMKYHSQSKHFMESNSLTTSITRNTSQVI